MKKTFIFATRAVKIAPAFLLGASLAFLVILLVTDEPWAQLATFGFLVYLALAFATGLLVLALASFMRRHVGPIAILAAWAVMTTQMVSPAWTHGPIFAFHLESALFGTTVAGVWLLVTWREVINHDRRYSLSFRSRIARNSGKVNAMAVTVDSTT